MPRFYETTLSITNLHNLSISTHVNRSRIYEKTYFYTGAMLLTIIYLNAAYNSIALTQINNRSAQSRVDGMGAIFTKDLRIKTEQDPLPTLLKIGNGAFLDSVTYNGNAYSKNWTGVLRIISSSEIND